MRYPEKKYLPALILILMISLLTANAACTRRSRPFAYNGVWWVNTPLEQRLGFIDGFLDCHNYALQEPEKLTDSRSSYETAVSKYYDEHRGDRSMLAGRVLVRVADNLSKGGKPGEVYDGRIWLKYSEKERMGFVEGYLNALMPTSSRSVRFPKSPEYYANRITRWYSIASPDTSQSGNLDDPLKQKISKILWGMRNSGQLSGETSK